MAGVPVASWRDETGFEYTIGKGCNINKEAVIVSSVMQANAERDTTQFTMIS